MKTLIFILFLILLPAQSLAIIDAEGLGVGVDKEGVNGKAGLSVNGSSGNSDKISAEGSARLAWLHGEQTEILVASHAYGKSRGVRDTNRSFVHLRHRYAWSGALDVEGFAQAQQNEFARLKLRTLLGGGVRLKQQSGDWRYYLGLGSFYESETLRRSAALEPKSRLWRGNSYLIMHAALNELVSLENTVYFQPAWRDSSDYRFLENASLHVSLTDSLSLRLSIELEQDSRPPAGVKTSDVNYKTGLEFKF